MILSILIGACGGPEKIIRGPQSIEENGFESQLISESEETLKKVHLSISENNQTLIVEFFVSPTEETLEVISKRIPGISINKFINFDSSYFKRVYEVKFFGSEEKREIIKKDLEKIDSIKKVERDYYFESNSIVVDDNTEKLTKDTFSHFQWGVNNIGQKILKDIDDIHLETIIGKNGADINLKPSLLLLNGLMKEDVLVAVLDSGIDIKHPDLAANIYRNTAECNSIGEPPFKPTEDKDGNGYIGDCMGFNFTSKTEGGDNIVTDKNGHGTHVAGIIAAISGNDLGVSGLSNRLKIIPVKVLGEQENESDSSGPSRNNENVNGPLTTRIAKGIIYAIKAGAKVINLSLGWPSIMDTTYLRESFKEAHKKGIIIVAASGNNNNNSHVYPCSYEDVICVSSIGPDGKISNFSNYGGHVDILAPGDNILSTYPTAKDPDLFGVKGFEIKNGTSQAAPFVAGIAAILKGINPGLSNLDIRDKLTNGTKKKNSFGLEKEKYTSFGEVDLTNSINKKSIGRMVPVFKENKTITINAESRSFDQTITFQNYGKDIKNAKIKISNQRNDINIENETFLLEDIAKDSTRQIQIKGHIDDLYSDNNLVLNFSIESDGVNEKYINEYKLNRELTTNSSDFENYLIELNKEDIPRGRRGEKAPLPNLRTIPDPYFLNNYPEYYVERRSKDAENPGLNIVLYKKEGDIFKENTQLFLPNGLILNFILSVDLNYDQNPDYLVGSIAVKDDKKYIQFSHFSKDGKPLYGEYSHFELKESNVFLEDIRKISFIPIVTKELGKIAALSFFNNNEKNHASLVDADQNPDPWVSKDYTKGPHFFYFKPELEDSKFVLRPRSVDNYKWRTQLKKQLSLSWNDEINILDLLPQSLTEKRLGISRGLISVGKNFFTRPYLVDLNTDDVLQIKELKVKNENLEGHQIIPTLELNEIPTVNAQTTFAGHFDTTTVRMAQFDGYKKSSKNSILRPTVYINIRSDKSKRCITHDLSKSELYLLDCKNDNNDLQSFELIEIDEDIVQIKNKSSNNCFTIDKQKFNSFYFKNPLKESPCEKSNKQQLFKKFIIADKTYLKNIGSENCLYTPPLSSRNYDSIYSQPCKKDETYSFSITSLENSIEKTPITSNEDFIESYNFIKSTLFKNDEKRDHIIKTLASYKKDDHYLYFFETKSNLIFLTTDSKKDKFKYTSRPITRFSFLPGSIFSETLFPIYWGEGMDKKPAIYIDGTQLIKGGIHILGADVNGQITSPIIYNLKIPDNCSTLNPIPLGNDKTYSYSLICQNENNNLELKYLKLK